MSATPDPQTMRARLLAFAWMSLLLGAALVLGWCAKALYAGSMNPHRLFFEVSDRILSAQLSTLSAALMICVLVSGIDNWLLTISAALTVDGRPHGPAAPITASRFAVFAAAIVAVMVASYAKGALIDRFLVAWSVLGASFGPLLLVRLSGKRIRSGPLLGAMWAGCSLTVLFHILPAGPGDFLQRVLPFVAALGIALTGGERRRNPDRADRTQTTVHDHLPI